MAPRPPGLAGHLDAFPVGACRTCNNPCVNLYPPYSLPVAQAGTLEPLLENLPGAPDGVSTAADGSFWVALVSPVPPIAKLLRDPVVRALYAWLPTWARPPLEKWGAVAKVGGVKQHSGAAPLQSFGCLLLCAGRARRTMCKWPVA